MIYSMTAFVSHLHESPLGQITIDIKSVNNRFLDLSFRLPEECRHAEPPLRELITTRVNRGKMDIRLSLQQQKNDQALLIDHDVLGQIKEQYHLAKQMLSELNPPTFSEVLHLSQQGKKTSDSSQTWQKYCVEATEKALLLFLEMRAREGQRLAQTMLSYLETIEERLQLVRAQLPAIQKEYQEKLSRKLRETLEAVCPAGFEFIKAEELSARLSAESSLFSLRIDVAEELDRLQSHQQELTDLLRHHLNNETRHLEKNKQSLGKKLDFIFQEMNREINTLGSKSTALSITQTVIELKLLVEQLREQAQNIE